MLLSLVLASALLPLKLEARIVDPYDKEHDAQLAREYSELQAQLARDREARKAEEARKAREAEEARKAEAARKAREEAEAARKAQAEAARKAEEAQKAAEAEAQKKAQEEAARKEAEAKAATAEAEARKAAEAQKLAEAEAQKAREEAEATRKAAEAKKAQEEAAHKAEEARKKAEAEARKAEEAQAQKKAEEKTAAEKSAREARVATQKEQAQKKAQKAQDTAIAALGSNYAIFLSNINDLNKRLGELRANPYSQGSWLRIFNGMSSSARNEAFKTYSTNVQIGYDYALDNSGNESKHYLGVAFSYGYNKIDGSSLTGRANLFEVGAYYSYVSNAGFYNDTILKYALIDNELSLSNNQAQGISLNTSNVSLGEEFGYRWDFLLKENNSIHHRLYLEPQAELILGYLSNGSISQVNGNAYLNSNLESILAFRGRIGGVIGYSLKAFKNQTDFRVGLSYVGDLVGGGKINLKSNFSSAEGKIESNQMGMVSVGVNSMITDSLRLYLDVDTSFGGTYFNQDYLVSIGGRYSFGKKNSSFARGVQAKQKEDKAKQNQTKQDKAKEKALKDKQAKEAKAAQALKAKQEKAAKAKSSSKAQPTKAQPAKAQPSKAQSNKAQPSKSQSNKGGK